LRWEQVAQIHRQQGADRALAGDDERGDDFVGRRTDGADDRNSRSDPGQCGESSRHEKLFTYLPISKANCRLAPDGWPLPKSGANS
jgi:hypothetical protein